MSIELTWRTYLDEIVRRMTAGEKQGLFGQIGVSRITIQRWRSGENTPDAARVHLLLNALPREEGEQLRLLMTEDLKMRALLPIERTSLGPTDKIPQEVYEEVLRIGRDSPDRFWLLCSTIFYHAILQLDPTQSGVEILVAKCMPPRSDKIRSLRAYAGRGTSPWRSDLHMKDLFLGAESLAGYAVMKRHGVLVPDRNENDYNTMVPVHWMQEELACTAYPILREGAVAGALVVSAAISPFFTSERLSLIEKYADLIRLAFYDQEFYPSSMIDLALMPDWQVQKQYFSSFRQRVNEEYKRAVRDGQTLEQLTQAETRVREAFEGELLHLASVSDEGITVS